MNNQERIAAELEKLISEGREIISSCGLIDGEWQRRWPSDDEYLRVRTRASNLIRRVCGRDSPHCEEIENLPKDSRQLVGVVGILDAAKADFEAGLLFNLKALVEAEIFGDFLDQSEALLGAGYHVPAASLAGAVLEDTLRKISDVAGIKYEPKAKIGNLSSDLVKAGVYNLLQHKQITALADIRNNADHGHFEKFKETDVEGMIKWVKGFASEYLK